MTVQEIQDFAVKHGMGSDASGVFVKTDIAGEEFFLRSVLPHGSRQCLIAALGGEFSRTTFGAVLNAAEKFGSRDLPVLVKKGTTLYDVESLAKGSVNDVVSALILQSSGTPSQTQLFEGAA